MAAEEQGDMQQAPSEDVDTCEVINPAYKDALCECSVRLMERRHDNVPAAATGHSLGWGRIGFKR